MNRARAALQRLRDAADDGRLEALARRHHVRLLGAFGSTTDPDWPDPDDLDIAVEFERDAEVDFIQVILDLMDLVRFEDIDVMNLNRAGAIAKTSGLVGGEPLLRVGAWSLRARPGVRREGADGHRLAAAHRAGVARLVTPRRFDAAVVQAKLAHLQRLLNELEQIGSVTFERLMSESITRLAIERLLTQFVEVAAGINAYLGAALLGDARVSHRSSFDLAVKVGALSPETSERVAPSTGTRNTLVHEYLDVDYHKVAEAARRAPEDYGSYVDEVAAFLLRREEGEE